MFRQSPRRSHRHRAMKVKHVLQIVLLVGICTLLVYQMQESHGEGHENAKISEKLQFGGENFKLGRKDLMPRKEQVTEEQVKQKDEEIDHLLDEGNKHRDKGEDHETSEENDPRENLETSLDNESKDDNGNKENEDVGVREKMSAGDEETKEKKDIKTNDNEDYQQNSIGVVRFKDRDGSNPLEGNNQLQDSIIYLASAPTSAPGSASAPTSAPRSASAPTSAPRSASAPTSAPGSASAPTSAPGSASAPTSAPGSAPASAPASKIYWGLDGIKQLMRETVSVIQKDGQTENPTSPMGMKTNRDDWNLDLSPSASPSPPISTSTPTLSSLFPNMDKLKESLFSGSPSKIESAIQFMKGKASEISAPTPSPDGNAGNFGSPTSYSQEEKEAAPSKMDVFAESPTDTNILPLLI